MEIYGIIYKTTCLVNGKIYIGQTIHWQDKSYLGSGDALCEAVKKYGRKKFKRKILKVCYSQKQLDVWEMIMIRKYNSTDKSIGYNILSGTANEFGSINPAHIPEVVEKIRRKKKAKWRGEKCYWFGRKLSEETKKKLSNKAKKRLSDPTKAPMYGKHLSDEAKLKISKSRIGKQSPRKGVKLSEETKRKLSKANTGKRVINNGVINKVINENETLPKDWVYGRCKKK